MPRAAARRRRSLRWGRRAPALREKAIRDPARRRRRHRRPARPQPVPPPGRLRGAAAEDRKSTRLNSSHANISYAVFCLKKKKKKNNTHLFIKKKTKQQ